MGQVEGVIAQLDRSAAGKQKVGVYRVKSAQPQQVVKVLQDLFQKNGATSTSSRTASSAQTDPLETRSTTQSQAQQTGSNSRSGMGGGLGSGLGGAGGGLAGGGLP
jgi:hypothetical protein